MFTVNELVSLGHKRQHSMLTESTAERSAPWRTSCTAQSVLPFKAAI
jgi:hypothetical protein